MEGVRGTSFAVAALRDVRENISTSHIPLQMVETSQAAEVRVDASLGHLSVHVEGDHPAEVPFLFEQQQKRLPSAFAASLGYHIVMAVAILDRKSVV